MTNAEVGCLDARLAAALPPGSLYAVGGRVRDEQRGRYDGVHYPLKDLDYVATGIELPELLERLGAAGRTEVVGARFAVVKFTSEGVTADVALPRRERSTGVGHRDFAVEAGPAVPLEDDLARRDFRINMLARALPDGGVVDPYGGIADIAARRIDLLREDAFVEDPLRMLRACQFAARFEYAISERTMAAMRESAALVATVSPERVRDELLKMLVARRPSLGFDAMRAGGLLAVLLPELERGAGVEQNEWHAHDVLRHSLETLDATPGDDVILRLAALLHDVAKPQTKDGPHFYRHEIIGEDIARDILARLRFSNEQIDTVSRLVRGHMYVADPEQSARAIRRFVHRVGAAHLPRLFALRAADIAGSGLPKRDDRNERFQERVALLLSEKPPLSVRDLAIDGGTVRDLLVAAGRLPRGSRGGPEVGRILSALLDAVIDEPSLNDAATLKAQAQALAVDP